ncbi:MAG: NYN domain-containing protein [Deltaproteobacteria bacterium]|nr:NYN domain-containing protein [Deltaproteobacteria bacterium]
MRSAILGILQTLSIVLGFAAAGLAAAALYPPVMAQHAWLVDGFNVIQVGLLAGREREHWWGPARRSELREHAEQLDDPDAEVLLVFDGSEPGPAETGRTRTVFAPSADDWILARLRQAADPGILARLRQAADPGDIRVVTADRRLAARVRSRGAEVVSPAAFLQRCTP